MSTLQSVVDELASSELDELSDVELRNELIELRSQMTALEGQWLRRVRSLDARQAYEADGALSARSWLRHRCGLSGAAASRSVRIARALRSMPATEDALRAGTVGIERIGVLAAAADRHPEVFERDEQLLLDMAETMAFADFRKAVTYWRHAADDSEALRTAEALHRRRRLHVSKTFAGTVRIDGELDPEGGEIVLTALRSLVDPARRNGDDDRTAAQMRVDALVDLCHRYLDSRGAPKVGGQRPHVMVIVDWRALVGEAGFRCELNGTDVISAETARRIACDAGVSRVIMDGTSEILDLGRKTRVVSPAMRRSLVLRDGGCAAPGCDRPHEWCDAHHIVHWIDGGPTALWNLILLCRRHHRLLHEGKLRIDRLIPLRE